MSNSDLSKQIYHNSIKIEKVLKHLLKKHSLLSKDRLPSNYKAIYPSTIRQLEHMNYTNVCDIAKLLHINPKMSDAYTDKEQWSLDLDKYYISHYGNAIATAKHFNKIKSYYNRTFVSEGTVLNNHYKLFEQGKSVSISKLRLLKIIKVLISKDKNIYLENCRQLKRALSNTLHISKVVVGRCMNRLISKRLVIIDTHKTSINLIGLKRYSHNINLKTSWN